jgi:hypothetical protein
MGNRIRCGAFDVIVGLGLLFATPLFAQSAAPAGGQGPPGTPPKVVDAKGNFVGYLLGQDIVERNVNGVWVAMGAHAPIGFDITDPTRIFFFFQSGDCSGTKYISVFDLPVPGIVTTLPPSITENTLFFPGRPVQQLVIGSERRFDSNGVASCVPVGPNPPGGLFVGPVQTVSVASAASHSKRG